MTRCFGLVALVPLLVSLAADLREADLDCLRLEFARAAETAQAVLRSEPGNADAWVILGRARIGLGNTAEALDALRQALTLRPGHEDGLYFTSKLAAVLSTQKSQALVSNNCGRRPRIERA